MTDDRSFRTLRVAARIAPEELDRIDRIAAHLRRERSDILRAASDEVLLADVVRASREIAEATP